MRHAVLLYNPKAGKGHTQRLRDIEAVATALRDNAVKTRILATEGPGTAGRQASEACQQGADTIFACGGDGTVHDVLQGMAFQPEAALGIIPLGSANVLARHLGLPLDPVAAALRQLDFEPRTIPIGQVKFQTPTGEQSRYFIVMAGAGADGALVYKMLGSGKHHLGRMMYYLRSAALFLRARFSPFTVTSDRSTSRAVSAMAVRVVDLGGLFSPLVRGGSIEDPQLLLTTIATPGHLSLPSWFAYSWARLHRFNPYVHTERTTQFHCSQGETHPIQVQADGEWLGRTPMTAALLPNAVRILMPPSSKSLHI